jgi:hypothetical protein
VIQLSKFLNHTLAAHNQVDSFFENINHNDDKGAFTLTPFEMAITDCPGFHVPHCIFNRTYLFKTKISEKKNDIQTTEMHYFRPLTLVLKVMNKNEKRSTQIMHNLHSKWKKLSFYLLDVQMISSPHSTK